MLMIDKYGIKRTGTHKTLEKRKHQGVAKYDKKEDCWVIPARGGGYVYYYPNRLSPDEEAEQKQKNKHGRKQKHDNTNGFIVYRWLKGDF